MHTPRVFINARQVNELTGLSSTLLKYYRNRGKIKGYRIEQGTEWLYRLDQVNRLSHEKFTRQNPTNLVIVNAIEKHEGVEA
jgi:predicted site-specific integrase-resolvase